MAIDPKWRKSPVFPLNRMLWEALKSQGILSETNYDGHRPLIPVQEVSDFMTIIDRQPGIDSKPYIVYTWNRIATNDNWFLKTYEVAYAVRATDDLYMQYILNVFERLFEDQDVAARRLNRFVRGQEVKFGSSTIPAQPLAPAPGGIPDSYKTFRYKYINLTSLGGPMPSEDENGPNEAIISLRVTYTD